jgi:ribosomal protein L40E
LPPRIQRRLDSPFLPICLRCALLCAGGAVRCHRCRSNRAGKGPP